jgi:radical SAM superfamily enzyme YgiQ (UPF0313 family)
MKLTLVNLYPEDTIGRYLLSSYVLKAYLQKYWTGSSALEVHVINHSAGEASSEICESIVNTHPDCVGYSCYVWNVATIFEVMRELKSRLDSIHIVGGPEVSTKGIMSLPQPHMVDYFVIGEGERKLLRLLHFLESKRRGEHVESPKGVVRWERDKTVYEEDTDSITDLDEIPSVYLSGSIDKSLYARQQAFIETQRGCRFKCKYCVYHKKLPAIHYYSLGRILDELDHLVLENQVMALRIFDAIFTSDLDRAKAIVRHLLHIKATKRMCLPWLYWEFRYDGVDEEFIKLTACLKNRDNILNAERLHPLDRPQFYSEMVKDYTVVNSVGIESCYGKALNAVGRPALNPDKLGAFITLVRENNVVLKIDLILGLPQETPETYFQGLEFLIPFLKDTDHILNLHRLQIIPGCGLEERCTEYGIRYSRTAPHLVTSTNTFSHQEMIHASKVSAVLFRILNSPLRKQFFNVHEQTRKTFHSLATDIYGKVVASEDFTETRLVRDHQVEDEYWNNEIFGDIPSEWLINTMEEVSRTGEK